jgi:hypothetical protein
MDEKAKELRWHTAQREPLAPEPGQPGKEVTRQDYGYKRGGMANMFIVCEPLRGWRRVRVTQDRTAKTVAAQLKKMVDQDYPDAEVVVLVTDNVNTHGVWSLYEAFEPAEAKRIADKLEWHYTPEHGSWLNIAEIELSALERQCLNRRIPDCQSLVHEVGAWERARNEAAIAIKWHFTTSDARIKLRRLYPGLS